MSVSTEGDVSPKMKLHYFKDKLEFIQDEADTPGMNKGFGKYNLGIKLNEENLKEIERLAKKYKTESPVKGNLLFYLKEKNLSAKQKIEILFQGPMTVKVKFQLTGVCENLDTNVKYLMFRTLGLKKVSDIVVVVIQRMILKESIFLNPFVGFEKIF